MTREHGDGIPEEVKCTRVDFAAFFQTLPGVLLLPSAQHELLVGSVTLGAKMVSCSLQHRGRHVDLKDHQGAEQNLKDR